MGSGFPDPGGREFLGLLVRLDMGYHVYPERQAAILRPPSRYINQSAFDIIAFRQDILRLPDRQLRR
jgi:hypothetical protein